MNRSVTISLCIHTIQRQSLSLSENVLYICHCTTDSMGQFSTCVFVLTDMKTQISPLVLLFRLTLWIICGAAWLFSTAVALVLSHPYNRIKLLRSLRMETESFQGGSYTLGQTLFRQITGSERNGGISTAYSKHNRRSTLSALVLECCCVLQERPTEGLTCSVSPPSKQTVFWAGLRYIWQNV